MTTKTGPDREAALREALRLAEMNRATFQHDQVALVADAILEARAEEAKRIQREADDAIGFAIKIGGVTGGIEIVRNYCVRRIESLRAQISQRKGEGND